MEQAKLDSIVTIKGQWKVVALELGGNLSDIPLAKLQLIADKGRYGIICVSQDLLEPVSDLTTGGGQ